MDETLGAGELWEIVRAQQEQINSLEARLAPAATSSAAEPRIGRRAALGLAGAGVAAAAAMVGRPGAVAAANGDSITVGQLTSGTSTTFLDIQGAAGDGLHVKRFGGQAIDSALRVENLQAEGTAVLTGVGLTVRGQTAIIADSEDGVGLRATSTKNYGATFEGEGTGQIRLIPSLVRGTNNLLDEPGSLRVDSAGDLYLCTSSANSGTWVKLNGQTAGFRQGPTFLPVSTRGYDSRTGSAGSGLKQKFAAAETRVVNIATDTGIPAGKSAAIVNITVTNTAAPGGFVSIYSGAVTVAGEPTFSNINWFGASQNLANSATVAISPTGTIKIYASVPTDVLIDVVGYYD